MSIREDANNDRMVRDVLGYDPQKRIAHLERENRALMTEVSRLKALLRTRLLNGGKDNG